MAEKAWAEKIKREGASDALAFEMGFRACGPPGYKLSSLYGLRITYLYTYTVADLQAYP